MKRIKTYIKTINKTTTKRIVSGLIILFFAMTILFQKDTPTKELQFVWNMDETFLHQAPSTQRDYLFQNESGETTYQGTLTETPSTIASSTDSLLNIADIEQMISALQTIPTPTIETLYTGTIIDTQITGTIPTAILDCITPWGEQVKHKDFVLAYEQRRDVNTICNIQKRICMSGTLLGSFEQRSCRDDIIYDYRKAEVISYNQKILNEHIQPPPPVNIGAEFDTQGKIGTTEKPTTTRGTSNDPVEIDVSIHQTPQPRRADCRTPRGQTINHGQFTKAYKAPRGFINLACEVEIRACTDGTLRGNFRYATCTFNNTTYEDYIAAGSPSSNTGFLFFQRIKKLFGN